MLRGREKLYFQDFLQLMTAGGIVSRNLRAWKRKQRLARRTKSDTDLLSSKSPHPSGGTSERSERRVRVRQELGLPDAPFTLPSAEPPQPSRSVSFTAGTDVRADDGPPIGHGRGASHDRAKFPPAADRRAHLTWLPELQTLLTPGCD